MRRLVLVVLSGALACKPAPAPPPDVAAIAAAAGSFVQSYGLILCQWQNCLTPTSPAGVKALCTPLPQQYVDAAANAAAGVIAGRAQFNSVDAQSCLTALAAYGGSSCWGPNAPRQPIDDAFNASCNAVFTGQVAPGDPCFTSWECSGGFCDDSLDACPGHCQVLRTKGVVCTADSECASGLSCGANGTCLPPAAAGEDCYETRCQPGLACVGSQCVTPMSGMVCAQPSDCGSALTCSIQAGASTGVCQALVPPGGACVAPVDCQGLQLCIPSYPMNICASPVDVGAACGSSGLSGAPAGQCFADVPCNASTSQCSPLPSAGDFCLNEELCDSSSYCTNQNGDYVCAAQKSTGDSCTPFQDVCKQGSCAPTLDGGTCVTTVPPDGDCLAP
jgi:hypothetical protein